MKTSAIRCTIKPTWRDAGKSGRVLYPHPVYCNRQEWTPVLWDGEEDPDFHKTAGLEISLVQ